MVRTELGALLPELRAQHQRDIARGAGWVELPEALSVKLPNAARELA